MLKLKIFFQRTFPFIRQCRRGTAFGTNHAGGAVGIGDLLVIIDLITHIYPHRTIGCAITRLDTAAGIAHLEYRQ